MDQTAGAPLLSAWLRAQVPTAVATAGPTFTLKREGDRVAAPTLAGLAGRMYIAGLLPNSPENLIRWIEDPTAIDPQTAMPDVGVTPSDARDIAAYLYTLK